MQENRNSFVAFLVACFAVVGLAGVFASYAAPLPYQRAFARLAALEQPAQPNSAAPVPGAPAPAPAADSPSARRAILAEAEAEAGAVLPRLRLLVGVLTALAALFGAGIMLLLRSQASRTAALPPGETAH